MEREGQISRLIRESGVITAPDRFTDHVMDKIGTETEKKPYKAIIGRSGRIIIILLVLGTVLLSILFSEPGSRFTETRLQLPELSFTLDFLSDINLSTGLLSVLVAVFILVLFDAGLNRRRLI